MIAKYIVNVTTALFQMSRKHYLLLMAMIILVISGIYYVDKPIINFVSHHYSPTLYHIASAISITGQLWFVVLLLLLMLFVARLMYKEYYQKLYQVIYITIPALFYTAIFNYILKFIIGRERPYVHLNPYSFFHYIKNIHIDLPITYNSMPSGHVIIVATAVSIIACHYKSFRYCAIFIVILMCVCRIYTLNHYPSDVLLAAILGMLIGKTTHGISYKQSAT